ncbi:MAG: bifunctional riboflavin kinase/FAD synthetase [Dermatophilaceae bacterium]
MRVWTGIDDVPKDVGPSVVTLGNFDGVHRGHRAVLTTVVAHATASDLMSIAVTFDPHPIAVLRPDLAPPMVASLRQRIALLDATGLDAVLVAEFTKEFAAQTPEEFVRTMFVGALGAAVVVVGEDTRFGARNSGSVDTLKELGEQLGFEVIVLKDIGEGGRWSSSRARELVASGDVRAAAEVLGRPHRVDGLVVHGDHRGRTLGFPTANLGGDIDGMVPADGVYAGWLTRLDLPAGSFDRVLPAAISIGTNPTFHGIGRRVEGYVLDRTDLDLYGERIAYEFVSRLRPTLTFDGIEPLVEQMNADVSECRSVLGQIVPS